VYPLVDEDAIARRNALNCLADPMAVVDACGGCPWWSAGSTALQPPRHRDCPWTGAAGLDGGQSGRSGHTRRVRELSLEDLTALDQSVTEAIAALNSIDARMRGEGGPEVAPTSRPFWRSSRRLNRVFREQLALRSDGAAWVSRTRRRTARVRGVRRGAIKSRQDAARALDAVADYFRRNEPSSPVPLLVERAKRLVAKDFLEVLADIAPEALAGARLGRVRDQ